MIRWMVVALLLVYGVADAGMSAPRRGAVAAAGGGSVTCNASPFITQYTSNSGFSLGNGDNNYYVGIINTSASPLYICSIDLYVRENGSLAGQTLYIERWTYNSVTGAMIAKQEDVGSVDATTLPNPLAYLNFETDTTLAQNEVLVFTMLANTGATNYATVAFYNGTVIADQHVRTWDSSLAATGGGGGADIRAKFYGAP